MIPGRRGRREWRNGSRRRAVTAALAAAVLGGSLSAGGCARPSPFTARNLLLLSMDTLRADRLGCYGDPDARTPFWDRLAREGCQFRTMVSPAPFTLPSHASLLSGARPWEHGARQNESTSFSPPDPTLAEILSSVGVATAAFVGSDVLAAETGISRGFSEYDWRGPPGAHERPAEQVVGAALRWIGALDRGRGFFLFVHVYDAHDPYEPPPPWRDVLADPYAGEIAATDRWLLRLLWGLEEQGRLERTMVVATADHGEAFGEHGETGHGFLLHATTLRIPLVLWGPLPFRGGIVRTDLARTIDVLPTVLESFRVGTRANRPGRPLQKRLKPYKERELAAYAETFYAATQFGAADLRSVRLGPWKYVRAPREELYDLAEDPGEETNLAETDPERTAEMRARLEAKLGDDLWSPAHLAERHEIPADRLEALAALGYLSADHEVDWSDLSGRRDPKDLVAIPTLLDTARVRAAEGDWDEAVPLAQEVLDIDPANPEAVELLARERFGRGFLDEGLAVYDRALEERPDSAELWSDYGGILLRRQRPEAAMAAFGRAIELDGANLDLRVRFATAALRAKRVAAARRALQEVLSVDPGHAAARRMLGNLPQ